jgi:hypothetical protein
MKCRARQCHTRLLWRGPCGAKPRPPSPNHHMRSASFWDFMQRRAVIPYRHFSTTYRSQLQGSRNQKKRTERDWSYLTQSCLGLCTSSDFLKKPFILEAGLCFHVLRQRNTQTGWPSRGSCSQSLCTTGTVRYAPKNRYSPRIITGKWLLKNVKL